MRHIHADVPAEARLPSGVAGPGGGNASIPENGTAFDWAAFPLGAVPPDEQPPKFEPSHDWALVFSLGKVGSTSFWGSLSSGLGYEDYVDETRASYPPVIKAHVGNIAKDYLHYAANRTDRPIWVFTAVRNPFNQKVSMYFEDIEMKRWRITWEALLGMNASAVHEDFLAWCKNFEHSTYMDVQYSETFKDAIGVNLTDYTFPEDAKRLIVRGSSPHGKPVIVVLVRFEDMPNWLEILRPIIPWFTMCHRQDSSKVFYFDKYTEFKHTFSWPPELAEEVMRSSMMHFYPEGLRKAFLKEALRAKDPSGEAAVGLHGPGDVMAPWPARGCND